MLTMIMYVSPASGSEKETHIWDKVTVLGTKENEANLPGSGGSISAEEIRRHSYDDPNRALRYIPGVYIRGEDGFGLFPNISLRGVDTNRSSKVMLLEDGIPAAPAPYSAPSAYYSPTTGRMNKIEVLKGSSQVKYGPHTSGGVVNYISTPIPYERELYLKALGGSHYEGRIHGYFGDTVKTKHGRFGYLLEEYYRRNDGFKTIDTKPDYPDGSNTGFQKSEPMFKMMWETDEKADRYHRIETKIGYTDLDADESYLGLSEDDFDSDPYRRYSTTRYDNIQTENTRSHLKYTTDITDASSVTLTGYYSEFHRNWFKLHSIGGGTTSNLSEALAKGGVDLAILKGEAAGTLTVRNNRRDYQVYGYQGAFNFDVPLGNVKNSIEIGLGYHRDWIRRNQNNEIFTQDASGVITGSTTTAPGTAGNRRQESDALYTYFRDKIDIGSWSFTPGIRYERVNYEFVDFDTSGTDPEMITIRDNSDISALAGGIGINYRLNDILSLYGGVHQGYSLPGPRDNAKSGLTEEKSLTGEIGLRYLSDNKASSTEFTYFYTTFDDLLVKDNIGGAGTGTTENVGEAVSQGIEWKTQYDLGIAKKKEFKNPYYIVLTFTDAVLKGDSNSTDPESIFAGGKDGNKVPYIPDIQFTVGTGIEFKKWGAFIDGTYVDSTYTTANNVDNLTRPDGTLDARFGKTDRYFIVDLSGYYRFNINTKFVLSLHNLFDQQYVVSRHPHGPRPGKPFTAAAGLEMIF